MEPEDEMSKPIRIQRWRIKGWRKPPGAVCITRPGPWGNPYGTAYAFRHWLAGDMDDFRGFQERRAWILAHVHELKDKDLCCYCPLDRECHGDILIELANKEATWARADDGGVRVVASFS